MAHATDYPSQRDISNLRKSSSFMNRTSKSTEGDVAYNLISNFFLIILIGVLIPYILIVLQPMQIMVLLGML